MTQEKILARVIRDNMPLTVKPVVNADTWQDIARGITGLLEGD